MGGSTKIFVMIVLLRHLNGWIVSVFRSREDLVLENLVLREQLLVLHAERPRQRLSARHKVFWVMLRKLWAGWQKPFLLVTPRTVVDWHRAGFRLYWKWLSRARQRDGRKPVSQEIRAWIFRMAAENPIWGAPRIHGELLQRSCLPFQPVDGYRSNLASDRCLPKMKRLCTCNPLCCVPTRTSCACCDACLEIWASWRNMVLTRHCLSRS